MLFENLVSLIDGKLLNEPSISSFSSIAFDAKKLKRGDLYFGEKESIDEALENGAYGVVSTAVKVKDKEIAWIKVKDVYAAKLKLLRYFIVKENLYVISLDSIKTEFAKTLQNDRDLLFINENIDDSIKLLNSYHDYKLVIFNNKKLYDNMELDSYKVEIFNTIQIQKSTNFLTTFIYHDRLYKDMKISELFKGELEYVLNLFDSLDIEYNLLKLNFISHFKPLFLDSSFKVLPFGQSRKVVILEKEQSLLEREIKFLKEKASWAKLLLLLSKDIKCNIKDIDIKYYKNYADVKKQNIFYYNFVIMLDLEERFEKYLLKTDNSTINSLF